MKPKLRHAHFHGKQLVEALGSVAMLRNAPGAGEWLGAKVGVDQVRKGMPLMSDGCCAEDMHLILSGRFEITVLNTRVAIRNPGEHVGEMGLLLAGKRTATVTALEDSAVVCIPKKLLNALGERFPQVWKNLARTLAERLDQRRNLLREPNAEPRIFIASSTEGKPIVKTLMGALTGMGTLVPWHNEAVFTLSSNTAQTLCLEAQKADFAIAVLSPDDSLRLRGKRLKSARDNVLFEAGLFTGAIGLERTFVLTAKGHNLRIPSDLAGISLAEYSLGKGQRPRVNITAAAKAIRARVGVLGIR